MRSNDRRAGSSRAGVVIFVTAPPLFRFTKPDDGLERHAHVETGLAGLALGTLPPGDSRQQQRRSRRPALSRTGSRRHPFLLLLTRRRAGIRGVSRSEPAQTGEADRDRAPKCFIYRGLAFNGRLLGIVEAATGGVNKPALAIPCDDDAATMRQIPTGYSPAPRDRTSAAPSTSPLSDIGIPGQFPVHARRPARHVPRPALDDAAVRGLRNRRRVQPPLSLPARPRRHRPERRLRPARRRSATTRTIRWRRARSAASASRSTRSRTWPRCSTASPSTACRRR